MNEPSARSDAKHCPLCGSKIPFSLALHMMAVHSPEAMARTAKAMEEGAPEVERPAPPRARPAGAGDGKGQKHRGGPRFSRSHGKRRH